MLGEHVEKQLAELVGTKVESKIIYGSTSHNFQERFMLIEHWPISRRSCQVASPIHFPSCHVDLAPVFYLRRVVDRHEPQVHNQQKDLSIEFLF